MRHASTAKLERLFAVIVTMSVPAAGALGAAACGGSTDTSGSPGGSSSGGSSGASSSGTGSSSGAGSSGSSSGASSSSGSSSGVVVCGGCNCGPTSVTLDGGLPDAAAFPTDAGPFGDTIDGGLPYAECQKVCGPAAFSCSVESDGPPAVVSCNIVCLGRRPAGFGADEACGRTALGAHFAQAAQLEAASVPAFRRLARELARHRAPRRLVKAAERAAREEVRHARGAAALAKRFGARPAGFAADVRGERSLEDVAIENAVEGCVRETYGALVATWQAREARDPQVRAHMARIAKEETSHAALAWKADAWARGKLGRAAWERVEAAKESAVRELLAELAQGAVPVDVASVTGTPEPRVATRLAQQMAERLAA